MCSCAHNRSTTPFAHIVKFAVTIAVRNTGGMIQLGYTHTFTTSHDKPTGPAPNASKSWRSDLVSPWIGHTGGSRQDTHGTPLPLREAVQSDTHHNMVAERQKTTTNTRDGQPTHELAGDDPRADQDTVACHGRRRARPPRLLGPLARDLPRTQCQFRLKRQCCYVQDDKSLDSLVAKEKRKRRSGRRDA